MLQNALILRTDKFPGTSELDLLSPAGSGKD